MVIINDKLIHNSYQSIHHEGKKKLPALLPTTFWPDAVVTIGFATVCGLLDYNTLFPLIDALMTQSKTVGLVMTIAIAGSINIFPVLLAGWFANGRVDPKVRKTVLTTLAGMLAAMFLATFGLRMATLDITMAPTDQLDIGTSYSDVLDIGDDIESVSTDAAAEAENTFHPTAGQLVMAVLMGMEPLATSMLSFAIAFHYLSREEPDADINHRRIQVLNRLKEEIDLVTAAIAELNEDIEFDLTQYDENLYQNMRATILKEADIANNTAVTLLTQKLKDPEAITYLMEGGFQKEVRSAEVHPLPLEGDAFTKAA